MLSSALTLRGPLAKASLTAQQILLRKSENDRDRLELGEHHQSRGGRHIISLVHLANSTPAVKRCGNLGITKLRLCVVDGGLVGFDSGVQLVDQIALSVVRLIVEGTFLEKIRISGEKDLSVIELGEILVLPGDCSIELGLERARIDHRQKIALFHILAFLEGDFGKYPACLRMEGHRVEGLNGTDSVEVDRYVALLHDAGDNWYPSTRAAALAVCSRFCFRSVHGLPRGVLMAEIIPDSAEKEDAQKNEKPSKYSHNALTGYGMAQRLRSSSPVGVCRE